MQTCVHWIPYKSVHRIRILLPVKVPRCFNSHFQLASMALCQHLVGKTFLVAAMQPTSNVYWMLQNMHRFVECNFSLQNVIYASLSSGTMALRMPIEYTHQSLSLSHTFCCNFNLSVFVLCFGFRICVFFSSFLGRRRQQSTTFASALFVDCTSFSKWRICTRYDALTQHKKLSFGSMFDERYTFIQ